MRSIKKFIIVWLPTILWCGLIFWLSSIPSLQTGQGGIHTLFRKLVHIGEYTTLAMLLFRSLHFSIRLPSKIITSTFFLALLYAVSDEVHQLFVPTRSGKVTDLLFDSLGIIIGIGLFLAIIKFHSQKIIKTQSANQTRELAKSLAKRLKGGEILALSGDLGSGKTTFVQGLLQGLESTQKAQSPTFILRRQYQAANNLQLIHYDLYRLTTSQEALSLGIAEDWNNKNTIVVIEWAEKIKDLLPAHTRSIYFKHLSENSREIHFG